EEAGAAKRGAPRKIIYTAQAELLVDDFDKAEEELLGLLAEHKGYVAKADAQGTPGTPRTGTWTLRVPAEQFETFLKQVARLGELRRSTTDSEDITDQYYDMKAEVRNLEAREEALRQLYKQKIAASKLEDLLAVDREISQVRGQINVRKGQLQ